MHEDRAVPGKRVVWVFGLNGYNIWSPRSLMGGLKS